MYFSKLTEVFELCVYYPDLFLDITSLAPRIGAYAYHRLFFTFALLLQLMFTYRPPAKNLSIQYP